MSEPRTTAQTTLVRKRDGQYEPFMPAKVAACLQRVMRASQEGDAGESSELTIAVCQVVRTTRGGGSVRSSELAAMLPKILEQTGYTQSAALLRAHARQRDRWRRRQRVLLESPSPATGRRLQSWSKGELAAWLMRRHDLDRSTARFMAGRVEAVVVSLGLGTVTSGLVRELAMSKLMAWGLCDEALRTHGGRAGS